MNAKQLWTEERAVSPVVGVALLIAITVILAAVIGGVVLGLGTGSVDAPQASLDIQETDVAGNVTITHNGGSSLNGNNVEVRNATGQLHDLGDLSAGGHSGEFNVTASDEISVVWMDPNSNDESVLARFDVSDIN